jgi:hypothetical protein
MDLLPVGLNLVARAWPRTFLNAAIAFGEEPSNIPVGLYGIRFLLTLTRS